MVKVELNGIGRVQRVNPQLGRREVQALTRGYRNIGRYIHPLCGCPYAGRMSSWKTPPEETTEDTAPLFAKMARVEGLALRVVDDERGDPSFNLLSLIVGWIAILQKRIGVAERWNRRAARKREMLGSEALRMNMCDRLGGVGALERWEERAKLAQSQHCRAGSSATSDRRSDVPFGTAPSPQRRPGSPEGVREFALPRMPSAGTRKVTTRSVRAAARYETPIPVWPCEVMPERFAREWWKEAPEKAHSKEDRDAFPEFAGGKYPGSREGEPDGYGARARDPGLNPGMRAGSEYGFDVGGPVAAQCHARAGTCVTECIA